MTAREKQLEEAPRFLGIPVVVSPFCPRTLPYAVEDWEERLDAMTAHHIVLGVLPLVSEEPAVFLIKNRGHDEVVTHPDNIPQFSPLGDSRE